MTSYSGTVNLSVSGQDDQGDTFTATTGIGISLSSLTLDSGTVQGTESVSGTIQATVHYATGSTNSASYPFDFPNFNFNQPLSKFNIPLGPLGTELGISLTETTSFNATRSVITVTASGTFDRVSNGVHLVGSASASGSLTAITSVFSIAPVTPTSGMEWRSQSGTTPFTFEVTRVGNTSAAGSTTWTVAGSGAQPATGLDFVGGVLPGGIVDFAAGQATATISVNATSGVLASLDDSFTVSVPAPATGELLIDSGTTKASDTIQNPLDTVVYISFTFADGVSGTASGVLIAPNEVLTAAHIVYSSVDGLVRKNSIVVTPAYNIGGSTQPLGTAGASAVHYNGNFTDPGGLVSLGVTQDDYAVITLNQSFTSPGDMGLYSSGGSDFAGGAVNVAGYPGGVDVSDSQQSVTVDPSNTSVFFGTSIGSGEGSSGGPVWTYGSDGSPQVVGLVSGGINGTSIGLFTDINTAALAEMQGGPDWIAVTCFRADTLIQTPGGEIAVQDLAAGDAVLTRRVGARSIEAFAIGETAHAWFAGTTPIKWIGHRHIDCRRHPKPQKVWPVRVCAGAFGEAMPQRDLWLSPDHAVYVSDVLIPIKRLINGTSIDQVPMDEVTYYHIELPEHDVLLAEGLPVESYLDTGDRFNFDNSGGPIALHPEFSERRRDTAQVWEALGCAPLIVTGPALEAARRFVNSYASTIRAANVHIA